MFLAYTVSSEEVQFRIPIKNAHYLLCLSVYTPDSGRKPRAWVADWHFIQNWTSPQKITNLNWKTITF